MLYDHRNSSDTLILDDCDSWLEEKSCHSTLMSATDTDKTGLVQWHDNSDVLKNRGVPDQFKFNGTMIILTNKLMIERTSSINSVDIRINQILSRMPAFCANLPDNEWNFIAIKLWYQQGAIQCFDENDLTDEEKEDIMDFVEENLSRITRLSFRTLAQLTKTLKSRGAMWRMSAEYDLA